MNWLMPSRKKSSVFPEQGGAVGIAPEVIIFTDLDGTLLDEDTYRWDEAKEALELCKKSRIPVVIVSSKTRAEIMPLIAEMGLDDPFISENGGGVFFPVSRFEEAPLPHVTKEAEVWRWSLGVDYQTVVRVFRVIREELGWDMRGFSDMEPEEVAELTGLSIDKALLASKREYGEPFIIVSPPKPDLAMLSEKAGKRNLTVTTGGRFHHIKGNCDKGAAVERLISWYGGLCGKRPFSAGLGDSENDLSMLAAVDRPVLLKGRQGLSLATALGGGVRTTREPGPRGWSEAVRELLEHINEWCN
jgi:mannosyl-3-phosphoglycerate phosphatase